MTIVTEWMILNIILTLVESSHFRGAIIQWKPLDAQNFDGRIQIHHRMTWRRDQCTAADIGTTRTFGSGSLNCRSGCSGLVGSLDFYCTDIDFDENWMSGERTFTYNIGKCGTSFEASFTGGNWIDLQYYSNGDNWEIRVKGNLVRRSNGRVNSSPVTTITPIRSLQSGCTHNIRIPVQDIDHDIIRCRWAHGGNSECAGVCNALPGATINQNTCVITWTASYSVGFYAVAIQIEDFIAPTSTIPMSSVPLQFLINVFSSSQPCTGGIRPSLVPGETPPDSSSVTIPFGTTYTTSIVATSGHTSENITKFIKSSPFGLIASPVYQSQFVTTHYYSNVTWVPLASQFGLNLFCFRAVSSNSFETDQSCITLIVEVAGPSVLSVSPMGTVLSIASTTWSITFDHPIIRPSSSRYINFYEMLSGRNVFNFDVTSSAATYPLDGGTMTFSFNANFTVGLEYYIQLQSGVAISEFSHLQSDAISDRSFWTFSIVPLSVDLSFARSTITRLESTTLECTAVISELFNLTLWRNDELLAQVNGDYLTYSTTPQSYGTYTCAVDGVQNSSSILQERGPFQLLLNDISSTQCQQLMNQDVDLKEAILAILGTLCQSCESLYLDNIADTRLNCSTSGGAAYLTAALVYSSSDGQITATTLINMLLSGENPALMVNGTTFALNQQCPTEHNPVTEEACINILNSIIVDSFTDSVTDSTLSLPALSSSVLIGVCFVAGLIVGIILMIIIISVIACARRIKACTTQPNEPHPPDSTGDNKCEEMTVSPNHAYEVMDVRYQTGRLGQDDEVIYELPEI